MLNEVLQQIPMKRLILICVASSLLITCSVRNTSHTRQMRSIYLDDFKIIYFKQLLLEVNNHSQAIKEVLEFDNSGYGEVLLSTEDFHLIDSLVKLDNQKMVKDSIDKIGTVSEGSQGKDVFDFAINKHQSKWLDSIAKARYKLYEKSEKDFKRWLNNKDND